MLSLNRPKLISASMTMRVNPESRPAKAPDINITKAPMTDWADRVKAMWAFSWEPSSFFRFHWRVKPYLGSSTGSNFPLPSSLWYFSGVLSTRTMSRWVTRVCWKRTFGWVISVRGKPGISVLAWLRPSGMFSTTPKSRALPRQAETQAGFRPTSRRSTHMLHLDTWPLTGSSWGAL